MPGDQEKYRHLPIPTYDEAVSSRPSSSHSHRGPAETSDDAERQGLLGRDGAVQQRLRNGNYHVPTVESARSSYESGYTSPAVSEDERDDDADADAELRRDMEQMEVTDDAQERRAQQRARMRRSLQKRIASITNTFSNIHLPRIPEAWSFPSPSACLAPFRGFGASEGRSFDFTVVARVAILLIVASLVYVLLVAKVFPSGRVMGGQRFEPASVREFLLRHVDAGKIRAQLKQVSYDDHMAGTKGDYFLADLIKKHFQSSNLDEVFTEEFEVYLNYPRPDGRSVSIIAPDNLRWTAVLEEDNAVETDHLEGQKHQAGVFHGHSKSGTVTGPLIYANYGSRKDFRFLKEAGIDVDGAIVLVRQYGNQPDQALKVKAAANAGAIGCLIYSDPEEDGFARGASSPDGPWRSVDSVQRGAVSVMSWVVGDVLTPGWASTPDADRRSSENSPALPVIPSLPLSARDGQVLMASLQGMGEPVPGGWQGGLTNTTYWTGSKERSPTIELKNEQDEIHKQPIRNVLGRIHGSEAIASTDAPVIYVGNHRDAWCFGGVDPGSGTAVFLEVVRVFGHLVANGWRPRRSIVFASWDGGDYNLAGSTEHVEARIYQLRQRGVAYINVDRGVYGNDFRAAGSPAFAQALQNALDVIVDPADNGSTLLRSWKRKGGRLRPLTGKGDYVPFQYLAGVSSLDIGFASDQDADSADKGYGGPAFPAQSCHDNMKWMNTHGDPLFGQHSVLAQLLSLLVHDLSDSALTPIDLRAYAAALSVYTAALTDTLHSRPGLAAPLANLQSAIDTLTASTDVFMRWDDNWAAMQAVAGPTLGESPELAAARATRNARKIEFESRLLDIPKPDGSPGGALAPVRGAGPPTRATRDEPAGGTDGGGIPGREQFKHIIYGPLAWGLEGNDDDAAGVFPAIRDAVDAEDWKSAARQVQLAAEIIRSAAEELVSNLEK